MRRIPLSTLLLGGLLVTLVAALGLYGWHRHVENQDPIRREINNLVAALQNPIEVHVELGRGTARRPLPLWPLGALAAVGLALAVLRRRERAQTRSRSNCS